MENTEAVKQLTLEKFKSKLKRGGLRLIDVRSNPSIAYKVLVEMDTEIKRLHESLRREQDHSNIIYPD